MFNFRNKNPELKTKKVNIKRIILILLVIIVGALIVTTIVFYRSNEKFRDFLDYTILQKEVTDESTVKIPLNIENISNVHAYNKNIVVLSKNILQIYNNLGKNTKELEISISNPIFEDNNRFLVVGEKNGNKIYLINGENIVWQKDLEGQISKINVNKNGYVTVSVSNSEYKTIIILYDPSGQELFKTYLRTTYALDIEISNDNKYMAIAEANTSGTIIQTDIRVVSIENAKSNPEEAFVATYNQESKELITNIKYHDRNQLISMYESGAYIADTEMKKIREIDQNTIFMDVEGNNNIISINKVSGTILKANYLLEIKDIVTLKNTEYELTNLPKELYVKDNIIAVNYGTEVDFIWNNGWLIKKYKSKQEVKNIVLTSNLAGVIYKDKIEIIEL